MMKRCLLCILLIAASFASAYADSKKPVRQEVYMFGIAASFTDSVAYITELQPIEVFVNSSGFLMDRSLYSLQLSNYFVTARQRENMTCAVFFNKNKAKAQKKYDKLRKKYNSKPTLSLETLNVDDFQFKQEEWVEEIITETSSTNTSKKKK